MPDTMDVWALVEHEKPLEKIQQPIPEPKGKEVLIKVTHCGVCHSDIHFWEGFYDLGGGRRLNIKDRGVKLPVAMGHEILGDIVKAGPDAGEQPAGARRAVYPWLGCGSCRRCAREEDNMCTAQKSLGIVQNGGYAEYVLVPDSRYLVDPGDVDPAVACTFGCSGITTLNAISKLMPLDPEEHVVLVGAGGLGLAAISILKAYGHEKIISVDIGDDKLEAARKAGATAVVNSTGADPAKEIMTAAGGPVLAVIDFVNISKTATMIQNILGKGAKWVQVGIMGGSVEVSLAGMVFKNTTMMGNITGDPKHLREVARLGREQKLPPLPVTKMPWDEVNKALTLLREGKVTGRLVLVRE
ncbi:hypothetical protein PMZ80_000818 [Knufia obscura]|uniref:Enoyl reductase (ER) domain-containing protein n=2 Tax=Knufia TaxID=430999 RepID=A0AAN8E9M8_9EURO|nr:hypothetical protein PMZ80_000818 [Knufia obscura]KAK5949919.1 hypothetical protein OHC33_009104 [Knufia fluminis]